MYVHASLDQVCLVLLVGCPGPLLVVWRWNRPLQGAQRVHVKPATRREQTSEKNVFLNNIASVRSRWCGSSGCVVFQTCFLAYPDPGLVPPTPLAYPTDPTPGEDPLDRSEYAPSSESRMTGPPTSELARSSTTSSSPRR